MPNPKTVDSTLLSVILGLCLIATLLFMLIPTDSLDTGLVYRGF